MDSDRVLAERIFFPMALMILCVTRDEDAETKQQRVSCVLKAIREHTDNMPVARSLKVERRAVRMCDMTIFNEPQKDNGEKALLALYSFIENQTHQGVLDVSQSDGFSIVMDQLLSAVDLQKEVTQKRLASSRKTANKWLSTLNNRGYFTHVRPIPAAA